jgi:hypothetical protein
VATGEIERLHYYQRQYLGVDDMEALQAYLRDMRRRHNLGPHAWGIHVGLELLEKPNECDPSAVDVFIQPGLATDGFGREVIVLSPCKVDPALFDSFVNEQHHSVWIEYIEERAQPPRYGYQVCDEADQHARIREMFRIVVDAVAPLHDAISVDGKTVAPPAIPSDESVPFQEFPDEDLAPQWLIPLGFVKWDGVNHKFIPASPDKAKEGRHYARLIGEQLMAPADNLVLRARLKASPLPIDPKDKDFAGVSAEVEGSLQIDRTTVAKGEVQLHGSRLSFLDDKGLDNGIPLWMQRISPAAGAADLRIHIGDGKIGDTAAANARLTIGNRNASGNAESIIADLRGDNQIDIPTGVLSFGSQTRQMIDLWTAADGKRLYGIGIQADTEYFRTHFDFCWFKGGVHSDATSDPGGGTRMMRLDRNGKLEIQGALDVGTEAHVHGNLVVDGTQNLVKVKTARQAVTNAGLNVAGTWTMNYPGEFSVVYTVFVVLQGFSIYGGAVDAVNPSHHDTSDGAIIQQAYVKVKTFDNNSATIEAYCSESNVFNEGDNQILFTVVVLGKGVM